MGLWQKLFKKNKKQEENTEKWEEIVCVRDKINFHDQEQRIRYVTSCLEQMAEATKELELLTGEYNLVTSYLTDMEEVEALPEEEKEILTLVAQKLIALEQDRKSFQGKKNRMPDPLFHQIRRQESEMEEGVRKLKETEKYSVLVKQDLKKLNGEKHAYEFRRNELTGILANLKGMAVIFLTALVICLGMLAVLQFAFEMNTYIGYFVAIIAAAIAITILSIKYMDTDKEFIKVENAYHKLIQLQNKVKIRYVNNTNLLDYLYIKFNTDSAARLEKRWKNYQQEKEERKQFTEAGTKIEYYQKQITNQLFQFRVKAPERWINQAGALLDRREMVEIRHDLILRRQALRKQLDYNNEVAKTARREITDLVVNYPRFSGEITSMVDRYEKKYK